MSQGYKAILYYGTAGSTAATQVTNCEDLQYNIDPEKGETTTRGDGSSVPLKYERVTALGAEVTWKMVDKVDSTLSALRAAAATGAAVAIKVLNKSGGTGFDGDVTLRVSAPFPLKGITMFEFTATPTDENRAASLNA